LTKNIVPSSLGLSTLLNFYQRSKVPLAELERFEDQFEHTGDFNDNPLWTPRIGRTEEEVRYFNAALLDWVWHFRDFFWLYAEKTLGLTREAARNLTANAVTNSDALKLCGFFANQRKHVEVTDFRSYPAFKARPPRLGEVSVHFLMDNGDTTYRTDLAGAEFHQSSSKFPFVQTVHIPGQRDTRRVAEEASWEWISLLKANGVDLGVTKPQWFECRPVIDYIGMGTSPKAIAARCIQYPQGIIGPPLDLSLLRIKIVGAFPPFTN
jgi:hypothetical protein